MNEPNLNTLVARTLLNVVAIAADAQFDVKGKEMPLITQELATLETLARRFEEGSLLAVEPEEPEDESDDDTDGT